jgi:hypothetical protein
VFQINLHPGLTQTNPFLPDLHQIRTLAPNHDTAFETRAETLDLRPTRRPHHHPWRFFGIRLETEDPRARGGRGRVRISVQRLRTAHDTNSGAWPLRYPGARQVGCEVSSQLSAPFDHGAFAFRRSVELLQTSLTRFPELRALELGTHRLRKMYPTPIPGPDGYPMGRHASRESSSSRARLLTTHHRMFIRIMFDSTTVGRRTWRWACK